MKKQNKPRCFLKYADDRICDICPYCQECIVQSALQIEAEKKGWSCKFKRTHEGTLTYYYSCSKDESKWIMCKPSISCFPELLRKEKIKKINKVK